MSIVTALALLLPLALFIFIVYLLVKAGGVKVLFAILILLLGFWLGRSTVGAALAHLLSQWATALHVNPHAQL